MDYVRILTLREFNRDAMVLAVAGEFDASVLMAAAEAIAGQALVFDSYTWSGEWLYAIEPDNQSRVFEIGLYKILT